ALRFNLERSIEDSAELGARGYLQTAVRLAVEQALMPRTMAFGSFGYINADFPGTTGHSNLFDLQVGARYLLTQRVTAGLEYNFAYRPSDAALPNYTRQIIELTLHGSL